MVNEKRTVSQAWEVRRVENQWTAKPFSLQNSIIPQVVGSELGAKKLKILKSNTFFNMYFLIFSSHTCI